MSLASAPPHLEQETDTEITLGTGKMLILFFGLVLLCAVFFGMGFTMGKNSVRSAPELQATPTGARPSAASQNPTAQPQATAPSNQAAPENTTTVSGQQPAQQAPAAADNAGQPAGSQPAPAGPGYFVQVAAVSKQEDADALVEALKGHGYSALIATPTSDKLYHVQVGPFTDIKDAETTRAKLVSDGYNPILKK
ncbi:MAG TPA: SPOR domain-containing protein [Terriglobales bacterium]|jgi:cell division septation protein DedD|nr:SPOR domain-containing protein [Terriglobales bacterium]